MAEGRPVFWAVSYSSSFFLLPPGLRAGSRCKLKSNEARPWAMRTLGKTAEARLAAKRTAVSHVLNMENRQACICTMASRYNEPIWADHRRPHLQNGRRRKTDRAVNNGTPKNFRSITRMLPGAMARWYPGCHIK